MAEVSLSNLDPRLQKQAENARLALERGNADYALQITGDILQKYPGCLQVRRIQRAAQIKIFAGKSRLFAKLGGTMTSAPFMMSASSLLKKDPAAAIEAAEKILTADPTNTAALRVEAEAATALGFFDTAVFCWESIRDIDPENLTVLQSLGEAYVRAGRFEQAISLGNRMLKLKPNSNEAQELLRYASVEQSMKKGNWEKETSYRDKLKDEEQAITLEQQAKVVTSEEMTWRLINDAYARFEKEPENLNNILDMADGYKALGDFAKALEWVSYARTLPSGSGDTTLEKRESELRVELAGKELADAEAALAASPSDAALQAAVTEKRANLAKVRMDEARALVERYPSDAGYRFEFGCLLFDAGQVEQAIAQFQGSQRSPKYRVKSLAMLGACFDAKGQFDLAVEQLQSAKSELTNLDDTKKDVIYKLAMAYEKMGKKEEAIAELKLIYAQDIAYRDVAARIDAFYKKS
jgi:tetratricopeptide (TPR) repeat protein